MFDIFKQFSSLLLSRTAKNTYLVFIGNILSAFFAFLFTLLLIRKFSFSDFGYFSALLSFLLLVSDISDIGIGSSLSRFLPSMEGERIRLLSFLKTSFITQILIAFLVSITLFYFSLSISNILFHTIRLDYLVKVTILGIFFVIILNFIQYVLSARQKFIQLSLLTAIVGLLRLLFLVILILTISVSLTNVVWMQVITFIISVIIAFCFLGIDFLAYKRSPGDFTKLISFASFLGIARAFTAIASRLDVLMLIAITNPNEAGIYSTASRVISIYPLLAGSFSVVIAPRLAAISDKKMMNKYIYKVTVGTAALIGSIIFMIIIAEPFMIMLFGEKTRITVPVFRLLLISMIFFVGSIPAVSLAIYHLKKPQILTINSVLQLLIVFLGNLIFIPRYARYGAGLSLVLAYGMTLFLTSILVYYSYKRHV